MVTATGSGRRNEQQEQKRLPRSSLVMHLLQAAINSNRHLFKQKKCYGYKYMIFRLCKDKEAILRITKIILSKPKNILIVRNKFKSH